MTRRLLVVLIVLAGALVAPSLAAGHVTLESATPEVQSSLGAAPTQILLRFTEPVAVSPTAIRVLAADGTVLSGAARTAAGDRVVIAPVSGLIRGSAYTVRWRVSGQDGHSPAGVFTFGVGVPAPPPTEAVGADATTWNDDLARWLLFTALALVIGPLALRLLVLRGPVPERLERRFHLVPTVRRSRSSTSASSRSSSVRRTRCNCQSRISSTATSSHSRRRPVLGSLSSR